MAVETQELKSVYGLLTDRDDFDWSVAVDENGVVRPGKPGPNHFVARPPVKVDFKGTDPDEGEAIALQNEKRFTKALFEISQSTDGRALLKLANHLGYTIQYDTKACDQIGAAGLCRYSDKTILLHSKSSSRDVAATLLHELKHMHKGYSSDISGGPSYEPKAQIQLSAASEADARVWELVGAYQIQFGDHRGPQNQYRSDFLVRQIEKKNPEMARQAREAKEHLFRGFTGVFAAKVFPAYFEMEKTRKFYLDIFYERTVIKRSLKELSASNYYSRSADPQDILASVKDLKGQSYMSGESVDLDLSNPALTGMTPEIARDLRSLQNTRRLMNPDLRDEADWDLPVLAKDTKGLVVRLWGQFKNVFTVGNAIAQTTAREMAETVSENPEEKPAIYIPADEDVVHDYYSLEDALTTIQEFRSRYERYVLEGHPVNFASEVSMIDMDADCVSSDHGGLKAGMILVEAGFRGPTAAFPEYYLRDLFGRMEHFDPNRSNLSRFRPCEIELFEHWLALEEYENPDIDMIVGDSQYSKPEHYKFVDLAGKQFLLNNIKPAFDKEPLKIEPPTAAAEL